MGFVKSRNQSVKDPRERSAVPVGSLAFAGTKTAPPGVHSVGGFVEGDSHSQVPAPGFRLKGEIDAFVPPGRVTGAALESDRRHWDAFDFDKLVVDEHLSLVGRDALAVSPAKQRQIVGESFNALIHIVPPVNHFSRTTVIHKPAVGG